MGYSEAGDTGHCEPPNAGTRNWTQIRWNISKLPDLWVTSPASATELIVKHPHNIPMYSNTISGDIQYTDQKFI